MPSPGDAYEETLRVPGAWWLLGGLLVVTVGWVFVVALPWPVAVAAALLCLVLVLLGLGWYGAVRVATEAAGFRAGAAVLDWGHVGRVTALDEEQTRRAAGVEADARAYLLLRTYCGGSVRVVVDDPADPAPYWLVSTRHPDELAAHLERRASSR